MMSAIIHNINVHATQKLVSVITNKYKTVTQQEEKICSNSLQVQDHGQDKSMVKKVKLNTTL